MKKILEDSNLRLMVFKSAEELGKKIDEHLLEIYGLDKDQYTFIVPIKESFFQDGHLKVEILDTVRGKDMYLITDVCNYSLEYKMHGFINHTSPNDLFTQLKDGIGACNCHADKVNIVMPLLYAGRQHRRNTRENLACGMALHEIDDMSRVRSLISFDVHDQGVEHSVHNMEFDNVPTSNAILEDVIRDLQIEDLRNIVFIAPDNGAVGRRNTYLNSFSSEHIHREGGSFIKQRDYNVLKNGMNPIIGHDYSGNPNLEGYTAIVIDDMISSGGSIFECIDELKKLGVNQIYVCVSFDLFTEGIEKFKEYYESGKFNGIYTTNLSYIPEEYRNMPWLHICDCSELVSKVIYNIHNNLSISDILKDRSYPAKLIEEKFEKAYAELDLSTEKEPKLTRNKPQN